VPVRWASEGPAAGLVFDVIVRLPGSNTWQPWQSGVTTTNATYTPVAPGLHQFRARLRGPGGSSLWSPAASVTVTS
jgi:hypothetical protein